MKNSSRGKKRPEPKGLLNQAKKETLLGKKTAVPAAGLRATCPPSGSPRPGGGPQVAASPPCVTLSSHVLGKQQQIEDRMAFEAEFILWTFLYHFLKSAALHGGEKMWDAGVSDTRGPGYSLRRRLPGSAAFLDCLLRLAAPTATSISSVRRSWQLLLPLAFLVFPDPHPAQELCLSSCGRSLFSMLALSSSSGGHGPLQQPVLIISCFMFCHPSLHHAWQCQFTLLKTGFYSYHVHARNASQFTIALSPSACLKIRGL